MRQPRLSDWLHMNECNTGPSITFVDVPQFLGETDEVVGATRSRAVDRRTNRGGASP